MSKIIFLALLLSLFGPLMPALESVAAIVSALAFIFKASACNFSFFSKLTTSFSLLLPSSSTPSSMVVVSAISSAPSEGIRPGRAPVSPAPSRCAI